MSTTVLLVAGVVLKGIAVPLIFASIVGMFVLLWVIVPVVSLRSGDNEVPAGRPSDS